MKHLIAAAAMTGTLLLAGCESLITGGPLVREGEPTGTIVVTNNSKSIIDAILISDCDASTYGLNRMSDGEKVAPGGKREFTVSAGCWDVDAGTFGAGELRQRVTVTAGGTTFYSYDPK